MVTFQPGEEERLAELKADAERNFDAELVNQHTWTPLMNACQEGYLEVVSFLTHVRHCTAETPSRGFLSRVAC